MQNIAPYLWSRTQPNTFVLRLDDNDTLESLVKKSLVVHAKERSLCIHLPRSITRITEFESLETIEKVVCEHIASCRGNKMAYIYHQLDRLLIHGEEPDLHPTEVFYEMDAVLSHVAGNFPKFLEWTGQRYLYFSWETNFFIKAITHPSKEAMDMNPFALRFRFNNWDAVKEPLSPDQLASIEAHDLEVLPLAIQYGCLTYLNGIIHKDGFQWDMMELLMEKNNKFCREAVSMALHQLLMECDWIIKKEGNCPEAEKFVNFIIKYGSQFESLSFGLAFAKALGGRRMYLFEFCAALRPLVELIEKHCPNLKELRYPHMWDFNRYGPFQSLTSLSIHENAIERCEFINENNFKAVKKLTLYKLSGHPFTYREELAIFENLEYLTFYAHDGTFTGEWDPAPFKNRSLKALFFRNINPGLNFLTEMEKLGIRTYVKNYG